LLIVVWVPTFVGMTVLWRTARHIFILPPESRFAPLYKSRAEKGSWSE
jgi:hypothetical protein